MKSWVASSQSASTDGGDKEWWFIAQVKAGFNWGGVWLKGKRVD